MVRPALNNVIVKVKNKFTQAITGVAKMAAIQNLSSIELGDYVTIVGEVVSVPLEISHKREYTGYCTNDIKPGDIAVFSHLVINDYVQRDEQEEPRFKNSFWYNGAEYFNCDILRLFAVIRDGEIRMQNGYVMLSQIEPPPTIFVPQHAKKSKKAIWGVVSSIAKDDNCKEGDTVYINPGTVESYKMNDKPFYIVRQQHIFGVDVTGRVG